MTKDTEHSKAPFYYHYLARMIRTNGNSRIKKESFDLYTIQVRNYNILHGTGSMSCQSCIYYNPPIHGNEIHCAVHPGQKQALSLECVDRTIK